jgi:hypothetical protein
VDQRPVHLLVEVEVEAVEGPIRVAKTGLLVASSQEPILATLKFIADERGHDVDRRELLRLCLSESGFDDIGHAGQPKIAKRVIQFDEPPMPMLVVLSCFRSWLVKW